MQISPQQEPEGLPQVQQTITAPEEPARPDQFEPKPPAGARPWLSELYVASLLVVTFALDQITKSWVRSNLLLGESIPATGLVRVTHTFNTGSAFGLFPNQTFILTLASVVGIGVLLLFLRKQAAPGIWLHTSLGLQLGGAAGNLVDRITLGRVTDFIQVGIWPVFNLADASIVTGLVILGWFLFRSPKEKSITAEEQKPVSSEDESVQTPISLPHDDPGGQEQR